MNFPKQEDFEYICRLGFEVFKIPIFFLNNQGESVFEHYIDPQHHLYDDLKGKLLNQLFLGDNTLHFPVFTETDYLGNLFSINIFFEEQFYGKIIVGPVLFSKIPEESIRGILNDFHLSINKEKLMEYYRSLPVISQWDFINISRFLFYTVYQKELDTVDIHQQNRLLEERRFNIEQPEIQVSKQRQTTMSYIDPLYEKKFFCCITEGKKDELIKVFQTRPKEWEIGVLSKTSQLRSIKKLAIAAITLATRAAVDGGLSPDIAYTLSDLFIQKLEELNEYRSVNQLLENAFVELTERVYKGKKLKYSKPINTCQIYIFSHVYEDISLSRLAELVEMNPNYLSNLFKKEVGITIKEYIQQAKVDEARSLLTFTPHSLTEISTLLNFHDQSYFTKVFKKIVGVTPSQFKRGIMESPKKEEQIPSCTINKKNPF
ncbi:AraC-type DNA-binding protein [Bacillus sp. 491mf]|uniref:helix-turn-helix domain-containing protein n=1 Tax=Bacillus sp. 491mf TaxID=1761755 RepID=UPI0008E9A6B4|nr:helix-turn-helix domain-containing protein [Bacillus sp. 491mf]SFC76618.1 AraC-type DNA-binding protein [Bacillus sp. 491mf]